MHQAFWWVDIQGLLELGLKIGSNTVKYFGVMAKWQAALSSAHPPIAQAPRRPGYMETTVSPAGMGLQTRTPVAAAMRSDDPSWGLFSDVLW